MLIAYGLVLVAVGMDFRSMRISNRLILIGLAISLIRRVFCDGMDGLFTGIFLISFPVILLYLLFLAGALGAGDIKLFSLIGGFINFRELLWCIVFAFLFAAIFSFVKLLYYDMFFSSVRNVGTYVYEILKGKRESYQPFSMEHGRIHFSLAILFGLIATDIIFIS